VPGLRCHTVGLGVCGVLDWAPEEKAQFLQHVIGRQVQEEKQREEATAQWAVVHTHTHEPGLQGQDPGLKHFVPQ